MVPLIAPAPRGLGEETEERFGGFRRHLGLCHLELMGVNKKKKAWAIWLGRSPVLYNKKVWVQFPVRTLPWAVGSIPSRHPWEATD